VDVQVEIVEKLSRKLRRFHAFHGDTPWRRPTSRRGKLRAE
jgi:hypothetical protein